MYMAQTTSSILNGFGCTKKTLYHNLLGVSIRILFILAVIPILGIQGYLYGLLAGYILQITLDMICLLQITSFTFSVENTLLLPTALALAGGWISQQFYQFLTLHLSVSPIFLLAAAGLFYCIIIASSQIFVEKLSY
jgi:stage V sporulation protein B